jgi:hypothetical protein
MNLQDNISFLKHQLKNTTELLEKAEAEQAKELAKPKSKRALFIHKNAFCVTGIGGTATHGFIGMVENDNAFIDKESAQLQAQRNTLVYRMRVAAAECPVDWDYCGNKFYPAWSHINKSYNCLASQVNRKSQLSHFACEEKLNMFMNSLSTDEQKLLICGVE